MAQPLLQNCDWHMIRLSVTRVEKNGLHFDKQAPLATASLTKFRHKTTLNSAEIISNSK